jgi:hypothetical protein
LSDVWSAGRFDGGADTAYLQKMILLCTIKRIRRMQTNRPAYRNTHIFHGGGAYAGCTGLFLAFPRGVEAGVGKKRLRIPDFYCI